MSDFDGAFDLVGLGCFLRGCPINVGAPCDWQLKLWDTAQHLSGDLPQPTGSLSSLARRVIFFLLRKKKENQHHLSCLV